MSWSKRFRIPNYFGDNGQYILKLPTGAYPDPINVLSNGNINLGMSFTHILKSPHVESSILPFPSVSGNNLSLSMSHALYVPIVKSEDFSFPTETPLNFAESCQTELNPV